VKIRAAVLERFGEPLVVQDVDLAGPGPGEVLVRLAACGVCHTDLYTASGVDPSGYSLCVLGHEGAGVVDCRSARTNICLKIREQHGKGYLPDGTTRRSRSGGLVGRSMAGDIDVDSFLSHRITIDEVNRGFDLMHHQDGIRSVIAYS
jgi:S-(hydroxymethyl)glutathione dehydrogenase/alcohol dehydrogenase